MSINVDPRAGSKGLILPLRKKIADVTADRMEFADVAFIGKGEGGTPVPVGIEYKKLGDLLQCMKDDRFTRHQLPGLRDCYEDIWLIVEGEWKPGTNGLLTVRRGRGFGFLPGRGRQQMRYSRLAKFLISLEVRGGVRFVHTTSLAETVEFVSALYQWWTFAPLEHHTSHIAASMKRGFTDHVGFLPPLPEVKALAQIDGVGRAKAEAILSHFGSLNNIMLSNPPLGWKAIKGIGPALANRIMEVFTRRYAHGSKSRRRRPRAQAR